MNLKNKFISLFIFITIFILAIVNIKNPEKTKFYLFTTKTEEISLGKLITITFLSGFTFSSLLSLISKNNLEESTDNLEESSEDNFDNYDEINKDDEDYLNQEYKSDRPPERDIRESQPTISVNYRFVDQENDYKTSKNPKKTKNDLNKERNDWINNDNDW